MLSEDDLLSKVIAFLRFPLILSIVFMHIDLADTVIGGKTLEGVDSLYAYGLFYNVLFKSISCLGVPFFFFVSGFLFFYKLDFSLAGYKYKLRRRVSSLLIPYIFWNLLVFILKLVTENMFPHLLSGDNKLIADYGLADFLRVFWRYNEMGPICYQFWFIRDLMVAVLVSPLIYYAIKYSRSLVVILLGILWIFNIWFDVTIDVDVFFFFSLGAWFSIHKRNFVVDFRPLFWPSAILYLLLVVVKSVLWSKGFEENSYITDLSILVGEITLISLTAKGLSCNLLKVSPFFAGCAFFIYACHGMPVSLLSKLWIKYLHPSGNLAMFGSSFAIFSIITLSSMLLYVILKRFCPRFLGFITGNR